MSHRCLTIVFWTFAATTISCSSHESRQPAETAAPERAIPTKSTPAENTGPLSLTLAAKQKTHVWCQPMMVEARLKNVSDSTLTLNPFLPVGFAWQVRMQTGYTEMRPLPESKQEGKKKWESVSCGEQFDNRSNVTVSVRRLTGTPWLGGMVCETGNNPYEHQPFELPPGEERVYQFDLDKACSNECIDGPGRFEVSVSYSSQSTTVINRTNERTGEKTTTTQPGRSWQGSVQSNPIVIEVIAPATR